MKSKEFPLRELSLGEVDIELVPDYCWRGNYTDPNLMVVTEAPTSFEIKAGIGFVSDADRLLEMVLADAGLKTGDFLRSFDAHRGGSKKLSLAELSASVRATTDPGEIFFYHLHVSPRLDGLGKVVAPTEEENFRNAAIFHELVLSLSPKHILLLGNGVTQPLLGKKNALASAGATLDYSFPDILSRARDQCNTDPWITAHIEEVQPRIVVSTDMLPAALFHNEKRLPGWQARLGRMVQSLGQKIEMVPKKTLVLTKYEHAREGLTRYLTEPLEVLCYDWETTSLNPCVHRDSIIVTLGLARDSKEGICIPVSHPEIKWLPEERQTIFKLIRQLLLRERAGTLGHNILFDNLVTRCDPLLEFDPLGQGRRLPGLRLETMYLAYVYDENSNRGLKELCNVYTDMHCYDEDLERFKEERKPLDYSRIPIEILGHYNANDCIATFRLFEYLTGALADDERGPFIDIALRLMAVQGQALEDMAYHGQKIDRAILFSEGRKHEERLREAVLKLMAAPEMRDFIALKRQKVAAKWAAARLRQPKNSERDYLAHVDPAADPKEIRARIKGWTNDLKFGRAILEEDQGIVRMGDGSLHPEHAFIAKLFSATRAVRFAFLDPSHDELEKWKPWLQDEEYQADEAEVRYSSQNAGYGYKPNFNTHGGGEMGEFFFEHLKFPINFLSEKTKKPSLSKEARSQLIGLHPILGDFFAYKDTVKEYSVYYKPVIRGFRLHDNNLDSEEIDWADRSHLEITIGKVVTGRSSAQRIQTFPRRGTVKNMYVSRFGEGLIVQGDMSQAELRVVASLANEQTMIEAYARGEDLHKITSELLFREAFTGCTDPKLRADYRAVAKRFNFAVIYGSGAPGLVLTCKRERAELLAVEGYNVEEVYEAAARELKLARSDPYAYARIEEEVDLLRVEIAEKILQRFFDAYPLLAEWISGVHAFVGQHGYYYSPFGRIRRLPGVASEDPREVADARRQAQNFPVQSAASDIAIVALAAMHREIEQRGLGALSIAAVHDSTIFDSPLDQAVATAELMGRRLCSAQQNFAELLPEFDLSWLKVPLGSDLEMGPSWGVSFPYREGRLLVESVENGAPQDLEIEVSEFWNYYKGVKEAA